MANTETKVITAHVPLPTEVRRILVGQYEMRYEMRYENVDSTMYVLRLWHTRENR